MRKRRSADCTSNLELDRLVLGELTEAERAGVLAHAANCERCAAARVELEADHRDFLAHTDLPMLAVDVLERTANHVETDRPAGWMWRLLVPSFSLAAIAAWLFAPTMPLQEAATDTVRSKGGFSVKAYVKHAEAPGDGALHAGEVLHPGDQLRFRISGDSPGYVVVVAQDASDHVSVYFPRGATAQAVAAGSDVDLPGAVELDATLGAETIVAVRCADAQPVAGIVTAAQNAHAAGVDTQLALPPGCAQTRYRINKTATPPAQ